MGVGGWGKSRLKTNSAQLKLKLGLSLAKSIKFKDFFEFDVFIFLYLVQVCGPESWIMAKFLGFPQIEDFRGKLFIANYFRIFVKTPHSRIFDLSILKDKKCDIDIARTRVIVVVTIEYV